MWYPEGVNRFGMVPDDGLKTNFYDDLLGDTDCYFTLAYRNYLLLWGKDWVNRFAHNQTLAREVLGFKNSPEKVIPLSRLLKTKDNPHPPPMPPLTKERLIALTTFTAADLVGTSKTINPKTFFTKKNLRKCLCYWTAADGSIVRDPTTVPKSERTPHAMLQPFRMYLMRVM